MRKYVPIVLLLLLVVGLISGCNLFQKPNVILEGKVTMGDGESPLGPSKIYVDDKVRVETEADGKFSLSLKPGKYSIVAEYNNKKSAPVEVELKKEKVTTLLKIEGLGHLSGTVKTSDGLVLNGAKLMLGKLELPLDAEGKYSMFVEPGNQELKVEYNGFVHKEMYNMPQGNSTKNITIAELAKRNITFEDNAGTARGALNVNVAVGTFATDIVTDNEGKASFIAPAGAATFKFSLPIPSAGVDLPFALSQDLGVETTVKADLEDKRIFFDDFTADTGKFELSNAIIADGKITSLDKSKRGYAWLKSPEMGASKDYIVVVKGIGDGQSYRVNVYVPDDLESIDLGVFRGIQSAIHPKGNSNSYQLSSFHGPGATGSGPWWGHKRDLDFNNGLLGQDPAHPVIELGSAKGIGYILDQENVYAAKIENLAAGNLFECYFNGEKLVEVLDTDEAYLYPWSEEPIAYQHNGGGIFLVFEAADGVVFHITEVAVYAL